MRRENLQSRIAPRRPRLRSALVLVASAPPDAGLVASPGGDVRVNSISPGPTRTPIFAQAGGASAEDAERGIENVAAAFAALLPTVQAMPGMIHAEDMAAAVFLAPDEARFVNGHDLIVDGGITAGRPAATMKAAWQTLAEGLRSASATRD